MIKNLLFIRILLAIALGLSLVGCPEGGAADPATRIHIADKYTVEGGVEITQPQHLLNNQYILFNKAEQNVSGLAFNMQEGKLSWEISLFPDSNGNYYVTQSSYYTFVWPSFSRKGELVVIDPRNGYTVFQISNSELQKGALAVSSGIAATESHIYALTGRSGIAVFDLDPDSHFPSFSHKISIPDIKDYGPNPQLYYAETIAKDPNSNDVFIGTYSVYEYGNVPDLYRIDTDTGEIKWKANVEYSDNGEDAIAGRFAGHVSSITLTRDVLVVQAGQSVQAFDPDTGERYWYYELRCHGEVPGDITQSQLFVPETGRVYFGRGSDYCYYSVSANKINPDPWSLDTQAYPYGATPQRGLPTYLNGIIYFFNGFLWAVDPYTGRPLGVSKNILWYGVNISIFNDGRYIYVPTPDAIYAFEPVRK